MLFETLENRRVLATITGQVVWDLNGDGIIAVDEPGLENRRVYIDQNNNNRYDDGEVFSLTDADGIYRLLDVPTGYHRVALDPQDGWQSTFPTGTGRWTVPVLLATQTIAGYDFAQLREFTPFQPGNLLISRASFSESDLLLEYTPDGQLVQAVVIPGSEGTSPVIARDLVLDSRGRVQIVNGYEDVRLMTFDPPRSADETLNVSEDFADGIADRFEVQSGVWSVQSGRYVAAPGSMLTGISTLTVSDPLPAQIQLQATVNVDPGTPGFFSKTFLVFDYRGPTDFKYAGGSSDANLWFIGRRTAAGWITDAAMIESIAASRDYRLEVLIEDGNRATLSVDGQTKLSHLFADSLLDGRLGLGADDAVSRFDDFVARQYATEAFTTLADPIWDLGKTVDAWGDVAAFGNFLFVNEHVDDRGTANGLIRFNVDDLSYERFSGGFSLPTDVTVGLDGLLYTLNATTSNTTVQVHDPTSMQAVRTLNINERLNSIAVDEAGQLYAVTDAGLKHFDSAGQFVKSTFLASGDDIVISRDGTLALSSNIRVDLIDRNFSSVSSFSILGNAGINFTSFATFVQSPVSDLPPGGEDVDHGVFTRGNILVSNSPLTNGPAMLYEYTPLGQLVREYEVPVFEPSGPRDVVVDGGGDVYLYNGTFEPRLTRFDPHLLPTTLQPVGFTDHLQVPGWNTADQPTFGGLAAYGDFVFATDTKTQFDTSAQQGIVRYNTAEGTVERFHASVGGIIDVTIGMDGLLYVLGPAETSSIGTVVRRYHPVTMQLLGTVTLPASHRAIAVDANGDIFAVHPKIHHYDRFGVVKRAYLEPGPVGMLGDVDIDIDGRLLIAARDGHVLLTDRGFTSLVRFMTRPSDGQNFAAFVGLSRGPLRANWDAFEVDQESVDNELDVRANDALNGAGAIVIVGTGPTSHGGTLAVVDGTRLLYTPAPGFVGVETFTYTVSNALAAPDDLTDTATVQVRVDGLANFFAVDDNYFGSEDTPVTVLPRGVLTNDGRPDIFDGITPGNILVTHSPVGVGGKALLQEYTRSGQLVRSVPLPNFSVGNFPEARDLVLDRLGKVQIFNGTDQPRLTQYDPVTGDLSHQVFDAWNVSRNVTFGGLAAWRNFVFATDQQVAGDTSPNQAGILRFDIEQGTAARFFDDGDFIDLAVGLDGLLYALGPGGPPAGQYIRVYQPQSMLLVRQIQLPTNMWDTRAITVDQNGQIYAVRAQDPRVYHLGPAGNILRMYNTGIGAEADFSDIDLYENGRDLLVANINVSNTNVSGDGDVLLFTTGFFGNPTILQAPDASSNMKFAAWVMAPVATVSGPLTVSSYTLPSHGTLDLEPDGTFNPDGTFLPDGSFTYTPNPDFYGRDTFTYVVQDAAGNQRSATVSVQIAPVNDPPVLVPAGPTDDSDEDDPYTFPLTAIINGPVGTTRISDADPNDPLGGIAVVGVAGQGSWTFSLDGVFFANVGVVSTESALLLPQRGYLRFTPDGGTGGTASITYRAWDESYRSWDSTAGGAGTKFSTIRYVCAVPGPIDPDTGLCTDDNPPNVEVYEAYSEAVDTLTLTMVDLNDAPLLLPSSPFLGTTDEETPFEAVVNSFVVGVSDPDAGAVFGGIAVVGAVGNGFWQYSLDGFFFSALPAVSDEAALILNADGYLRYIPNGLNGETATITYRAWDTTDGAAPGATIDVSRNGGTTAYSAATDTARLLVRDVNDAPFLAPSAPHLGITDVQTPIVAALGQFMVNISDVDHSDTNLGVAITGATGLGQWAYSLNGTTFVNLPAVSDAAAVLIPAGGQLRYTPDQTTPEIPTVTYRAWDRSAGSPGQVVDATATGGATPFSSATDTASLTVREVNDPPVLSGPTGPLDYVENDPPLAVFSQVVVTDQDSPDFEGGSLTVSLFSGWSSNDVLSVMSVGGIQVVGGTVLYDSGTGGQPIGTLGLQGFNLTVQFTTPQATLAAVQALARAVTYRNTSENPSATDRQLRLTVVDGDGGTDTATQQRTVKVIPVNDPPVAAGEIYQVYTTQALNVVVSQGVLANDFDVEGDPLTAILVDPPTGGTLNLRPDGSFVYTPNLLFFGLDTFTYKANDGQADSNIAAVGIDVLLPATNPSFSADVNGDAYLSPIDALQIANYLAVRGAGPVPQPNFPPPFIDPNGDGSVTSADLNLVANTIDAGGSRPVPPPNLMFPQGPAALGPGAYVQIRLQTSDANGAVLTSIPAGETFFVDVWVQDLRLSPLGVFAAYLDVHYDPSLAAVNGSLVSGADFSRFVSGTTSTLGVVNEAGGGRIASLPGGAEHRLLRIPFRAETRGVAQFTGEAADQSPASDILLFGIDGPIPLENIAFVGTSLQISGPPVAVNDTYWTWEDEALQVPAATGVLVNDIDDEGDLLRALLVSGPQHGTVALNLNGSFLYTPNPNYFGTDRFTYRANDGFFDSNVATVTVTVLGVDDPPIAVDDRYSVLRDGTLTVSAAQGVLANDVELDGQSMVAILQQGPLHGSLTLNPDGSFTYTPNAGFGGADQFTYVASDGLLQSEPATVHLDVLFGWQNPAHPTDISGDDWLSPRDVLMVVNDLRRTGGSRILPNPPAPPETAPPFLDVNGDGVVSEFDAGLVQQDLQQRGSLWLSEPLLNLPQPVPDLGEDPVVQFRLETTDLAGAAADQFALGEMFYLNVYVSDLRSGDTGVFSAYVDVFYNATGLTPAGDFEFGSDFPFVRTGNRQVPGLLDEVGGVHSMDGGDGTERLLFRIPFTATQGGSFVFQSDPTDNLPASEVTLFDIDGAIPASHIVFGTAAVAVSAIDSDGDGIPDLQEDAAPNLGDGNADGIPDRSQSRVASVRSIVSQQFVTLVAPAGLELRNVSSVGIPAGAAPPSGVTFPHGFFEFELVGLSPGGSATLTWLFESGATANTYYRFGVTPQNPTDHLMPHLSDGLSGARIFANRIELRAVDGVRGDDDLAANGIFVERGAPSWSNRPWQNPVLHSDVTNESGVTALDALTLINEINANGPRQLPMLPVDGQSMPPFWDANGDGWLTAGDVLQVVNYLNGAVSSPGGEGEWGADLQNAWATDRQDSTGTFARSSNETSRTVPAGTRTRSAENIYPAVDRVFSRYDDEESPSRLRTSSTTATIGTRADDTLWDTDPEKALADIAAEIAAVWNRA
ncbi:MAG: tandem-95 repeat protein [Pirellulaceae bacterium]|nr:tandem-95 repeat protein [Pirellulaceae bacterium]